jgi:hypothetical protein
MPRKKNKRKDRQAKQKAEAEQSKPKRQRVMMIDPVHSVGLAGQSMAILAAMAAAQKRR